LRQHRGCSRRSAAATCTAKPSSGCLESLVALTVFRQCLILRAVEGPGPAYDAFTALRSRIVATCPVQ
jgi:hypothetical protein